MRMILLVCGPVVAVMIYSLVPAVIQTPDGDELYLGHAGRFTAGMTVWMALWWITEAVSLYITALIPMLLLPLAGFQTAEDIAGSYGHRIVYLALGGFVLAAAIEKWHLHKRFAQAVIRLCGNNPRSIIAGFMIASAVLSMWISNVATAIIMLPVAISVIRLVHEDNPHYTSFSVCLLLSICYSCSIGGIGTLIGTGTNMFFAAYMEGSLERPMAFVDWMVIAVPLVVVLLPMTWLLMTTVLFRIPKSTEELHLDTESIFSDRPWSQGQVLTLGVFIGCALLWTFLPVIQSWLPLQYLTDTAVAIAAAILLFVIPAGGGKKDFLMDWQTAAHKVPWGILLLIGGGLCMAKAVSQFGVGELLAYQLHAINHLPDFIIIIAVVAMMVFLTEISSNIASVTALTPIFAAVALSRGMDPVQLVIPITIAASCAFMLPAATLTNSVIMGSGMVKGWEMARAGFVLNLAAIVVISLRFALGV